MNPLLDGLFAQWRALEAAQRLAHGEPDYGATAMARQWRALQAWQHNLDAIDVRQWDVEDQVDYQLIRAEGQALSFNLRVLQPWARDPAFYKSLWMEQSDTPEHEGPTHHGAIEWWSYRLPLGASDAARLAGELATIAPLLAQARINLTGDAGELWRAGIPVLVEQEQNLAHLAATAGQAAPALVPTIHAAQRATAEFVQWLKQQGAGKSGPSGVGRDNYNWYLRNAHLVPMDWDSEVALHRRELARAHASLRLEEHRNRHLPPLRPIATAGEYAERTEASVHTYMAFLRDQQILPLRPYMEPALQAHTGRFVEAGQRNFFAIVRHLEPMVLWCHWYHWFEIAQSQHEPHPRATRRGPLRFNIFDSRAEGLATAMEEMMLHAGLFDANPRARELVWIMLAQRAARGLASLYVQANRMTLQQAQDFHVRNTPRGWMRADLPLLQFEQHLYLRQPGYGTSYVSGKALIEQLLADYAEHRGDAFVLSEFFDAVNAAGVIPVSLLRWELTGRDDDMLTLGLIAA